MKRFLLTILFAVLSGCAAIGMAPADTFAKKVAAADVTVQTVADGAAAALAAGKITKEEAASVSKTARKALAAIDAAESLHATDPKAAEDKLAATLAILNALSAYLATQGAK